MTGDSIGEKVKRWRELAALAYGPDITDYVHGCYSAQGALREAAAEVECLDTERTDFMRLAVQARQRVERLEEALRWYATEAHKQKDIYGSGMNSPPQYLWYDDRGERARRALAEEKP